MKSKGVSPLRILFVIAICCSTVAIARADQSLNIDLSVSCSQLLDGCLLNDGFEYLVSFGGPESGSANFDPVAPGWSFSFQSAPATSWQYEEYVMGYYSYNAQFGYGGSFTMTAPGSLTFTGVVTSGNAFEFEIGGGGREGVDAFFFGQWSNGLYASGEADLGESFEVGAPYVNLHTAITPEPASIALFGSGILGIAEVLRRKVKL